MSSVTLESAAGIITPQMFNGQVGATLASQEYPPLPPVTPPDTTARMDKPETVTIPFGVGDELEDPALDDANKWVTVHLADGSSFKSEDPKTIEDANKLKELLKQEAAGLITKVKFNVVISVPGPKVSFSAATYSVKKKA